MDGAGVGRGVGRSPEAGCSGGGGAGTPARPLRARLEKGFEGLYGPVGAEVNLVVKLEYWDKRAGRWAGLPWRKLVDYHGGRLQVALVHEDFNSFQLYTADLAQSRANDPAKPTVVVPVHFPRGGRYLVSINFAVDAFDALDVCFDFLSRFGSVGERMKILSHSESLSLEVAGSHVDREIRPLWLTPKGHSKVITRVLQGQAGGRRLAFEFSDLLHFCCKKKAQVKGKQCSISAVRLNRPVQKRAHTGEAGALAGPNTQLFHVKEVELPHPGQTPGTTECVVVDLEMKSKWAKHMDPFMEQPLAVFVANRAADRIERGVGFFANRWGEVKPHLAEHLLTSKCHVLAERQQDPLLWGAPEDAPAYKRGNKFKVLVPVLGPGEHRVYFVGRHGPDAVVSGASFAVPKHGHGHAPGHLYEGTCFDFDGYSFEGYAKRSARPVGLPAAGGLRGRLPGLLLLLVAAAAAVGYAGRDRVPEKFKAAAGAAAAGALGHVAAWLERVVERARTVEHLLQQHLGAQAARPGPS